jgi:hypothetical protein
MSPMGKLSPQQIARVVADHRPAKNLTEDTTEPIEETEAPYAFEPALPADHFVSRFLAYAASRTDAALEYHELGGLILLAAATPRIRARLAPYPHGLATNLYGLLIGDSTRSRKTTSKDLALDIAERALPGVLLADQSSPEGFIEQLSQRPDDSTVWALDEMGDMLLKLNSAHYMAGFRGLLLTVYGSATYRHTRHSKRRSKEGGRQADEDVIERPHLSILGATTPALFHHLRDEDVVGGLFPRFAIVTPQGKPPRRPFFEAASETEVERNRLVAELQRIYAWAKSRERAVRFQPGALECIDQYAEQIEALAGASDDLAKTMLQRLTPMAVKVSMLVAAGAPGGTTYENLIVTPDHAEAAVLVGQRWKGYALDFAGRVGETDFERTLQRCLRIVRARQGIVFRRIVAKVAHVDKRTLDLVEATLADRGLIHVTYNETAHGPRSSVWRLDEARH